MTIVVSFQNCSKPVSFSSPSDEGVVGNPEPENPGEEPEDPDIIPTCANSPKQIKIIDINYASTNDCNWNNSGNLSKVNGAIRARHEESVNLSIPAGATLCDMELEFPEQPFTYDDHVILTLNNRIVMNTGSDMHQYLSQDGSGYIYDWSKLVGKTQDVGGTHLYCNGGSTCSVPNTEQNGQILVDIPKVVIQQIVTMAPQSVNQIKMITTGDDDVGDCNHTPISFKVKASYVE